MKVTVTTLSDDLFVLDVSEELELENFKAFCEIESGFPAPEIVIVHEGRPLRDNKMSMRSHGIKDGDVVILQHMANHPGSGAMNFNAPNTGGLTSLDFSTIQVPSGGGNSRQRSGSNNGGGSSSVGGNGSTTGAGSSAGTPSHPDPAHVRDLFLANPDQLALLKQNNPRLADALSTGRLQDFARVLNDQIAERDRRQEQRMRIMTADPFDTETQRLIAEEIRQKNIEANMEAAMEYNPETFGTVVMLYINCRVNGFPVKAFIDSGAQTTIMSAVCAERVNIMRLVDTRWAGIAKGVGVQKIIGRIHMVQVAIENDFLTTSFSVLEEQPMDMLLGLDMLKRHQCCIDLKKNVLRIGTTGTETPFLSEGDLPDCARLSSASEDDLRGAATSTAKNNPGRKKSRRQSAGGSGNNSGVTSPTSRANPMDTLVNILPTDNFTENEVKELVCFGFTREQVIGELRRFNGDKKQATAALFAKSLKF
ncbi:hypothetical protein AAG570_004852 [Ranatra chinensis]|uniref:Uncharacterized protein n=1 Tax=Ranatra chinensis TaxID=642074 RepID=A0ABD0XYR6_9HEMI